MGYLLDDLEKMAAIPDSIRKELQESADKVKEHRKG